MFGLSQEQQGFDLILVAGRTGLNFTALQKALEAAEAKDLLDRAYKTIGLAELGLRFVNDLQQLLL